MKYLSKFQIVFISKYKILNSFHIDNIELDKKPDLDLPINQFLHFKNMLELNINEDISKYIITTLKYQNILIIDIIFSLIFV